MHSSAIFVLGTTLLACAQAQTRTPNEPAWNSAYEKANAALAKMSIGDKVAIVTGVGWEGGPCVGNTGTARSVNFPALCLQDGPLGLRHGTSITAFTPGIQAASTWDVELIRQRGTYLGAEAKAMGVHVILGPVAGALGKIPTAGRNWEGFGPDPYLTGISMIESIKGIQSNGVQACAKHYIVNEQELNRETMSSNVDDRTMHELYLWPFADAVKANVASVMCSYNKVNGTWACESSSVMTKLLKEELGFPGYVVSDWNAQHTTQGSANAGMDMTMPGSDFNKMNALWGPRLQQAVQGGQVSQARLDDMARRVLASWYLLGQNGSYPNFNRGANVQGNHKENVRAVARDGIVLLKNDGGILPLKKPAKIAVIGSSSASAQGGPNFDSKTCPDKGCNIGPLAMGWGSGAVNLPYLVAPYDAIRARAQQDSTQVTLSSTDNGSQGAQAANGADVALVFITSTSGEGYITVETNAGDKNNLDPWHNGNQLVQQVAQSSKNVIVVVHSTGPIILETILAQPNVKAIVWAGLPSQENGNALVDVLWGSTNPNGKLPYTIGKRLQDWGATIQRGNDNFAEGLFIDYRYFDKNNIEPRYEFGFGLSYTNFTYADVKVTSTVKAGPAAGQVAPGGRADLYEDVATVTCTVTNSGGVAGAEVAQLYIGLPSGAPAAPPRQLRGFHKLKLAAGASGTATFNLRRKDLSYWDARAQNWVVPSGEFAISVGASSRDIRLTDKLVVS